MYTIRYRYLFTRQTYARMHYAGIVWMTARNWTAIRQTQQLDRVARKLRKLRKSR